MRSNVHAQRGVIDPLVDNAAYTSVTELGAALIQEDRLAFAIDADFAAWGSKTNFDIFYKLELLIRFFPSGLYQPRVLRMISD